jgi:hypothetical protein
VAPGRWAEAAIERDGRTVARLPYVVRGRGPLRMLTQAPLTPTLGPWVERSGAKPANALAAEMELLTALEAKLPPAQAFRQDFSPTMLNALPFFWAGYRAEVHYTYRLEGLASEDALWDGLRASMRGEIRRARKRVEIRESAALDRFHAVWSKTFARQGLKPPQSLAALQRLDAACAARGARVMLFAQDESDQLHAVLYVVWDEHAAYYLLGGADPHLRTSGAGSLLMWEAIRRAARVTDVFDFEGSMLRPLERYFRSFGSHQAPYLRVSRATPPARGALALGAGWRRLASRYEQRAGSRA